MRLLAGPPQVPTQFGLQNVPRMESRLQQVFGQTFLPFFLHVPVFLLYFLQASFAHFCLHFFASFGFDFGPSLLHFFASLHLFLPFLVSSARSSHDGPGEGTGEGPGEGTGEGTGSQSIMLPSGTQT